MNPEIFEPTNPELIQYGPEWSKPEWQGWTIQRVMSGNDLEVEGNRMNHCFAPGSLVRTINGYKNIEDIKMGEQVLCGEGTFNKVS